MVVPRDPSMNTIHILRALISRCLPVARSYASSPLLMVGPVSDFMKMEISVCCSNTDRAERHSDHSRDGLWAL